MASLHKLRDRLLNKVRKADRIFNLFKEDEKIILGISGGKDSLCMVDILSIYNINSGKGLELYGIYVDNGLGSLIEEEKQKIEKFLRERKIRFTVVEDNSTKEIIEHRTKPMRPCFICTRERRKRLLIEAQKIGAKKIALGHNLDDLIETLLLNIFFGREISTFLPRQELFEGEYFIIRPLVLIEAKVIEEYVKKADIPFIQSRCPFKDDNKREIVRKFLKELTRSYPPVKKNILRSIMNCNEDFLWMKYREWKDEIVR